MTDIQVLRCILTTCIFTLLDGGASRTTAVPNSIFFFSFQLLRFVFPPPFSLSPFEGRARQLRKTLVESPVTFVVASSSPSVVCVRRY